jgi:hypothetical protein
MCFGWRSNFFLRCPQEVLRTLKLLEPSANFLTLTWNATIIRRQQKTMFVCVKYLCLQNENWRQKFSTEYQKALLEFNLLLIIVHD